MVIHSLGNKERLRSLRELSGGSRQFLGESLHWLAETGSTNDDCRRLTEESGGRSVVVIADRQTAGRGQYGRTWEAPPGLGVLMSFSMPGPPPESVTLSIWAAAATAAMIERSFGLQPTVKWPNDVLVGGRKIAGVLVEVRGFAVVGIGLNVLQRPEDFPQDCRLPPTSIAMETGSATDRAAVAAALLDELERLAVPSLSEAQGRIFEAWRRRLDVQPGEPVAATLHDGSVAGEFLDLHPRDGLRLRTEKGAIRVPLVRMLRLERSPTKNLGEPGA